MIKYVKGDLLNAKQEIIVHQVNCQGVMGSGVAKLIKQKYPVVYSEYKDCCDDFTNSFDMMGNVQIFEIDGVKICNLFSQHDYLPRTIRHTNYEAMISGFNQLKEQTTGDVAMPKIGCGLGGGDWKIVSAIIESVFDDRDVYIYEL